MDRDQALETAREILHIMPLVMRTVVAGLRSAGELPAPDLADAEGTAPHPDRVGRTPRRQPANDVQLGHRVGSAGMGQANHPGNSPKGDLRGWGTEKVSAERRGHCS